VLYSIYAPSLPFEVRCESGICNSYTMARRDLPDIYALALGPHIYQVKIPTDHGISDIYHFSVLTKTYIGPFGSLYKRPSEF